MGKIAFVLGIVGSVVAGLLCSGRLVHRDYSASIVNKSGGHTTCPTLWVSFDHPPDEAVPPGFLTCGCAEQAVPELNGTPLHVPQAVLDACAPMDVIAVSFTQWTSPLSGEKSIGLSYVLRRGADGQTFEISPASSAYLGFAFVTALPFVGGIVVAVILGLLPGRKSSS